MEIGRRTFLKFSCIAAAGAAASGIVDPRKLLAAEMGGPWENLAILIDATKCIGCMSCVKACNKNNKLPDTNKYKFYTDADNWTTVKFTKLQDGGMAKLKVQCMHCATPSCASICPTGAARKIEGGIVVIDQDICIGCKNCIVACPFNVPGFSKETGTARKCEFCRDRLVRGMIPACVEACPAGTLEFGERSQLLGKAAARVGKLNKAGFNNAQIYGIQQLDGLKALYILPEAPEILGLPHSPKLANGDAVLKWSMGILAAGFAAVAPLKEIFQNSGKERPLTSEEGGESKDA